MILNPTYLLNGDWVFAILVYVKPASFAYTGLVKFLNGGWVLEKITSLEMKCFYLVIHKSKAHSTKKRYPVLNLFLQTNNHDAYACHEWGDLGVFLLG